MTRRMHDALLAEFQRTGNLGFWAVDLFLNQDREMFEHECRKAQATDSQSWEQGIRNAREGLIWLDVDAEEELDDE